MAASTPVCVLGLGKMGGAMARRLRDTGYTVVAWNRSQAATSALAAEGGGAAGGRVVAAAAAADAVSFARGADGSGPLVLCVLADTATTLAVLGDPSVAPLLRGRAVANLASGSPDDGRAVAAAMAATGAGAYFDGAYSGPPAKARAGGGVLFVSCADGAQLAPHRAALGALGTVVFAGGVGSSRALDYAVVDLAFVTLMSVAANAAMLEREGVDEKQLMECVAQRLATAPGMLAACYARMGAAARLPAAERAASYRTAPTATLATWRNFWASRLPYLDARRLPAQLPRFVVSLLDDAGAAAEGGADMTRVQEAMRFARL